MANLSFKKNAKKELTQLPEREREKVIRKLQDIAGDPLIGKRLKGEMSGYWTYRAWPYRIVYRFAVDTGIEIFAIRHRQGVYK